MAVKFDTFKGTKVIVLSRDDIDDKYPFIFGKQKAKLILQNLDAVREFAESD